MIETSAITDTPRPSTGQPVIEARSVRKEFPDGGDTVVAVELADLTLYPGEMVALVGPSGGGKSTLLEILGLLTTPTSGEVLLDGVPVASSARALARLRNEHFGYVHQALAIVEDDSVLANTAIPLEYARPRPGRKERLARCRDALTTVGMAWAERKRAGVLSGGEQQRVAVARALVNRPRILVADEPTASLDRANADHVLDEFVRVKELGVAILIATHDPVVAALCDRVVRMEGGRTAT